LPPQPGRWYLPGRQAEQMLEDAQSLAGHTAFLFEKINFFMDATIGFINSNQNRDIYKLTVLSVIFMPRKIRRTS
jgi:magnesium transporter